MSDVTIIIVSWNCLDDLADCLTSIKEGGATVAHRIIVVDNSSDDGTVAFLQSVHPDVHLIMNKENMGFAAANNQAMRLVRTRYLMLLNPDTVVRRGAIDALVHWMDEHPLAWACGPVMFNSDGSLQRTGVRFPSNRHLFFETLCLDRLFPQSRLFGAHRELFADPAVPRRVDYLQGACLLVRGDVLHRVGILDEDYFMYFEETDWCYRILRAGGEVWFVPAGEVIHHGGGTFAHYDERRLVFYFSSLLHFYRKHYPPVAAVVVRFLVLLRSIIRVAGWLLIALLRPSFRRQAWSSTRGYVRVLAVALGARPT